MNERETGNSRAVGYHNPRDTSERSYCIYASSRSISKRRESEPVHNPEYDETEGA